MASTTPHTRPVVTAIAFLAALLALAYGTYIAIRYSGNHLLVRAFSFRETQTALTSYWACRDGFKLAYDTPVAGYPWSIPFEFPLFQWIVSLISCPLGFDLERVGQLVSWTFLIACALPSARICKSLFSDRWPVYFAAFCAIFFSAPLHLFFGHAFLMETAALFFTLGFIAYTISLIQGDRTMRTAVIAGVYLTLAILQKSTTVLPLVPIFGFWLLAVGWGEIMADKARARVLWAGVVAIVIPFLIGVLWAKYSDVVKDDNVFGSQLTSKALMTWNFGGDRLDWKLWLWVIWLRNFDRNLGGWLGIGIVLGGLALLDWKHRKAIVAGVVLFLLYFMVFTNLQYVHEYYQISNEVFAIFAVTVALAGAMVSSNRVLSAAGVVALVALATVNIQTFRTGENFQSMRAEHGPSDPVLASAYFIRDNTDPEKPIVVYGDEWSSEFPLYSQRKAFVVMQYFKEYDAVVANPAKYFNGQEPSAVLVCRDARTPEFEEKVKSGFKSTTMKRLELCDIFLKG
ncbi:hypothetical protein SAMN05446927_5388 [Caballeronia arationis]|uniref:Glycosyltransferase RgtA/B/C/D-like domain-containing protein n=1 Tax=Caballeronia arationis TaxID=1777142 RepID=A0A7Z7IA37_9BURK|nr:hypothetical protein [Caballeronia arationis]SOE82080.1 hypothetical protein SAMN05446927_5388 [Caballeronia arationis]